MPRRPKKMNRKKGNRYFKRNARPKRNRTRRMRRGGTGR